jgi:hypothetical protein
MIRSHSKSRFNFDRLAVFLVVFASVLGGTMTAAQVPPIVIEDVGFEAAPGPANPWRAFQHAGVKAYEFARDKEVKTEGTQSLRISQREPQVYGAVRQSIAKPAPGKYEISAKMRSRETDGKGWRLEVAIIMENGDVLTEETKPMLGNVDWTTRELRFTIPPKALFLEVIVGLHGERGAGWIDELRLKSVP